MRSPLLSSYLLVITSLTISLTFPFLSINPLRACNPRCDHGLKLQLFRRAKNKEAQLSAPLAAPAAKSKIIEISTLPELRSALQRPGIKVIKFYATWCRNCAQIAPHYRRLAETYTTEWCEEQDFTLAIEHEQPITFYNVVVNDKNRELTEGLGVTSLPYAHVYVAQMLVEELMVTRKKFPAFAAKINDYERGQCIMPEDP